jgi:hypothetical protein
VFILHIFPWWSFPMKGDEIQTLDDVGFGSFSLFSSLKRRLWRIYII